MGKIIEEVEQGHLVEHSQERAILKPFLQDFSVTWAKKRRAFGSTLSTYFFKPEKHLERAFGFETEIMVVYSPYPSLEARTVQSLEQFISEEPARGRVSTLVVMVISEANDPVSWAKEYMGAFPEVRLIVAFSAVDLRSHSDDPWYVRSVLAEQLYQRDLFDYRLPISNDHFFFGREDLIFDFYNAFKRSENKGLFGLRKTGKTSVLFKLSRRINAANEGIVVYVDCKYPPIRTLRWEKLLLRVAREIGSKYGGLKTSQETHPADAFLEMVKAVSKTRRVCLIFDEIEYISPFSNLDRHWRSDFVPFWQTIWACQSQHRNLSVIVAGVNPTVVEKDLIDGVQNPLFGIVPVQYLRGLRVLEIQRMVRSLGRPMGLVFKGDAVEHLYERYGGQPLLVRIACSLLHKELRRTMTKLPVDVDSTALTNSEEEREAELCFYCRHIVSELEQFYEDEYALLSGLATGQLADLFELTASPEFTTHLSNYGLIGNDAAGRPTIAIPVLARFLGLEDARRSGRKTILAVVPKEQRRRWLDQRVEAINMNLEFLQQALERNNRNKLFGANSFPESHKFFHLPVVTNETDFSNFANVLNRCFVESIENFGATMGKEKYFWKEIRESYPALHDALLRIKLYRHHRVHIRLNPGVDAELRRYLMLDLGGRQPSSVNELWFQLQQCTLDALLVAILVELDRLN